MQGLVLSSKNGLFNFRLFVMLLGMGWSLFVGFFLFSLPYLANGNVITEFHNLNKANADKSAFEALANKEENLLAADKSLFFYGLGQKMSEFGDYLQAEKYLQESLLLGTTLEQPANLALANAYIQNGKTEAAKLKLSKVIRQKSYLKNEAQYKLANLLVKEGKTRQARKVFRYLERKMRRDNEYPSILWNLTKIDLNSKKSYRACRWIKKLYSRKPSYSKVDTWGLDPLSISVEDRRISCFIPTSTKKRRIRNLILTGYSDRAKKEVDAYVEKYREKNLYETNLLTSYYLIQEGFPKEAFKILVPYYPSYKNNSEYLLLLAKASVRAGEFQTAVGAYYKTYTLRRKSRSGRYALYQAAFLSYQFQDYDGAKRKFQEYVERYPWSGLTKTSYAHIAWLKYLKKDYKGALKAYNYLRRYRRVANKDQTLYWKAMTYYHLEDKKNAKRLFEVLVNDKNPSYYGLMAKNRLNTLDFKDLQRNIANVELNGEKSIEISEATKEPGEESEESIVNIDEIADSEDEKEEEEVADSEAEIDAIQGIASIGPADTSSVKEDKFRSSRAKKAFRKANDLIRLGFYDAARWELFQVEKSARSKEEKRLIIPLYEKIQAYHRSIHIATNVFIKDRYRHGLEGARDLWQGAYPKGYEAIVTKAAAEKEVDPYFVWSIIRAESQFRATAVSPVGAQGLMQLMKFTADRVAKMESLPEPSVESLQQASVNIPIGTAYLKRLLDKFNQQLPLAAAGYNAGPHRVKSWIRNFGSLDYDEFIEHIPFVETRNYVKKVLRFHYTYNQLYAKQDHKQYAWLTGKIPYSYTGEMPTREAW